MGVSHFQVDNTSQGLSEVIEELTRFSQAGNSIRAGVCEASGGYEEGLMSAMRAAGWPIHLANAKRVRAFAKRKGYLAKTDKLDAQLMQAYGEAMAVQGDKALGCGEQEQLGKDLQREKNPLEQDRDTAVKHSLQAHIRWLEEEITRLEQAIDPQLQTQEMKETQGLLTAVPGVGKLTASSIMAFLPELGQGKSKSLAALVGVAPFNHDRGKHRGKRCIQGGRACDASFIGLPSRQPAITSL